MNIRKIKLALTVGLLNNQSQNRNVLQSVKDLMLGFKEEVGAFLGQAVIEKAKLSRSHIKQTYAFRFEHCTLNIDLVLNPQTHTQIVQGFRFD